MRRESRLVGNEAASTATPDDSHYTDQPENQPGKSLVWLPCSWNSPQDRVSQIARRKAAARRLPVGSCGRHSDPLRCDCFDSKPPLSDNAIDGWRAAIERTLSIGPPVVPVEVLQLLYRNGGTDRQLAQRVWHETGGRVA